MRIETTQTATIEKKTRNVHANQLNDYTHFSLVLQEMKEHQFGV